MTATTPEISSRFIPRSGLAPEVSDEMFAVLSNHFDGVTRDQFERDLEEKNWVILLHKEDRLVGFSTMLAYETSFRGEPISVIYSGDTIVAEEARGSSALSSAWIASVNQLRKLYSNGRYYWLLLTSGFRTYRFLPVFWREFHPRFNAPTPLATKALMDYLALERFGGQYDPVSGIVRFTHPQRLKNGMAGIPDGRTQDAHIAFFAARNPGHVDGDELVCLTELTEANLTLAGRRMAFPNHPRLPCA